jgi:hypothetical protein
VSEQDVSEAQATHSFPSHIYVDHLGNKRHSDWQELGTKSESLHQNVYMTPSLAGLP